MAEPWNTIWNKVETFIDDTSTQIASKLPWEQSYTKASPTPDKLSVAPPRPLPEDSKNVGVDVVFNKLIQAESRGVHVDASGKLTTSSVGAEGITQLMPKTAANPGFGITPVKDKSESEYRRVGKEYLTKLYDKFGDWEKALAAYNYGLGNVNKAIGKAERFGGNWKDSLPTETKDYIKKIAGDMNV